MPKPNKRNGFYMFMEERRPQIEATGVILKRGWAQLSDILSGEWRELSAKEKAKYKQLAEAFNEEEKIHKAASMESSEECNANIPHSSRRPIIFSRPEGIRQLKRCQKANRELVINLLANEEWLSHPIIICSFNTYYEPNFDDMFTPAEIGLCAFNAMQGVVDNYARIISPCEVPEIYQNEASKQVARLNIPEIDVNKATQVPEMWKAKCEFSDNEPLMMTIHSFLEKYRGRFDVECYYVFALDSEFLAVARCFEYLNTYGGYDETLSVKVLSLNLYAFLASTHTEPAKRLPYFNSDQHPSLFPDSEDFDPASAISNPSPYRNPRMPLTEDFEYPSASEMTTIGVFNGEEAVEFLKQSWNFVHNSELCCVYHYKMGTAPGLCALNVANRYAYNILEMITISTPIPINNGHYPQVHPDKREANRRQGWLTKWGITKYEDRMREHTPSLSDGEVDADGDTSNVSSSGDSYENGAVGGMRFGNKNSPSTKKTGRSKEGTRSSTRPTIFNTVGDQCPVTETGVPNPYNGSLPVIFSCDAENDDLIKF